MNFIELFELCKILDLNQMYKKNHKFCNPLQSHLWSEVRIDIHTYTL